MSSERRRNLLPFLLAVAVHAAFAAFLFVNLDWVTNPQVPQQQVEVVKAVAIDESKIRAEEEKLKQQEERRRQEEEQRQQRIEEEKKRLADAEEKRKEEERKAEEAKKQRIDAEKKRAEELRKADEAKKQREIEEKARAEAERKRKEEAERKKREEEARKKKEEERKKKETAERKRKEEEARQRKEAEEALKRQLEEEQKALDAAAARQRARVMDLYVGAIKQDVERSWRQPPGATPDMNCVVRVTQIPGGEVIDAQLVRCNTNDANFRKSVVDAVYKASPLPRPADAALFERVLEFTFEPRN